VRRLDPLPGLALVVALLLGACAPTAGAVPTCEAGERLATVAQSVPGAAYVPCIRRLGAGWTARDFDVARGHTRFTLVSHATGARPVAVAFEATCSVAGAVPTTARAEGVRTSIRLRSISPRYAGTLSDVFPGGCVTYRFDFARGPHIVLMEDLQQIVGLYSRQDLRLQLHRQLGVELGQ
jgi:hypothetical protein